MEIVSNLRDPALLEYLGRGLVRLRVYPFEPGERRTFRIEYTQSLELSGNAYTLTYPFKIEALLTAPIGGVSILVETSEEIAEVFSPSHLFRETEIDGRRHFVFEGDDLRPDSDITLVFSAGVEEIPSSLVTRWDDTLNRGYFLLSLIPRIPEQTIIAKDVVFVLDISGSM